MKDFETCRTYLTHATAEHRRLGKSLLQAIAMIPNWEATSAVWREPMREHLTHLRAELAHHFAQEEQGGCMEEAIAQNPAVGEAADQTVAEHPRLLGQLDAMIVGLATMPDGDAQAARQFEQEFRQFVADFHQHEKSERKVLEEGFGVNFESFIDSSV